MHVQATYDRSLRWSMKHSLVILGLFVASIAGERRCCSRSCQQDFLPSDDTGQLHGQIAGRQRHLVRADGALCQQQVAEIVERRSQCRRRACRRWTAARPRRHQHRRLMHDRAQAVGSSASSAADEIIRELRPKLHGIPGINVFMQQSAHHPDRRRAWPRSSYQYTLQGLDLDELQDVFRQADERAAHDAAASSTSTATSMPQCPRCMCRSTATAPPPWASRRSRSKPRWARPSAASRFRRSTTSSDQYQVMLELSAAISAQMPSGASRRLYVTGTRTARWCR